MDIKTEIKEEDPYPEVISHRERESFSPDVTMKLNSIATVYIKVCETEIKEENIDLDFNAQNDWQHFSKTLVKKVKQCNDDYEREMNEACVDSDICSQNEEQFFSKVPAVTVNPCNKDSDLDTKIEIKEELQWLETTSAEAPSFDDGTEDSAVSSDKMFPGESSKSEDSEQEEYESAYIPALLDISVLVCPHNNLQICEGCDI